MEQEKSRTLSEILAVLHRNAVSDYKVAARRELRDGPVGHFVWTNEIKEREQRMEVFAALKDKVEELVAELLATRQRLHQYETEVVRPVPTALAEEIAEALKRAASKDSWAPTPEFSETLLGYADALWPPEVAAAAAARAAEGEVEPDGAEAPDGPAEGAAPEGGSEFGPTFRGG